MKLRNITYVNSEILDSYISVIDGGLYETAIITDAKSKNTGGQVSLSTPFVNAEGNLGKQKNESYEKTVKYTNANKLDRVIQYLNSNENLKYYEFLTEENFKDINREDFIEVLVKPRFSKVTEMAQIATKVKEMAEELQPLLEINMLNTSALQAIQGFETLDKLNSGNEISCIFNFDDNHYPLIGKINKNFIITSNDMLLSESTLLCKIQKKIEKGKSIEIDEIFDSVKNIPVNREQKREFSKNMSNPQILKDKISGPAFFVIPIALYQ